MWQLSHFLFQWRAISCFLIWFLWYFHCFLWLDELFSQISSYKKNCIALTLDVLLLVNSSSLSSFFMNSYSCKNLPFFWLYFPLLLFFTTVSCGLCLAGAPTHKLDSTLQRIMVLENAKERRSRQSKIIFLFFIFFLLQSLNMYYVFRKLKSANIFMESYLNHTKHLHTAFLSSVLLTKSKWFTIIS